MQCKAFATCSKKWETAFLMCTSDTMMGRLNRSIWGFPFWSEKCDPKRQTVITVLDLEADSEGEWDSGTVDSSADIWFLTSTLLVVLERVVWNYCSSHGVLKGHLLNVCIPLLSNSFVFRQQVKSNSPKITLVMNVRPPILCNTVLTTKNV